jgi:hypothetical protein
MKPKEFEKISETLTDIHTFIIFFCLIQLRFSFLSYIVLLEVFPAARAYFVASLSEGDINGRNY